ncbi:carboxylesterase/lipase family protein [Streptomyces sp. NRRL F-5727]|uniref:carboxylesterase/lipase family protein n=1 Tax=Streptomyces sp. NRRL F-5727 TaxID=1463871 RepID=UPI00068BDD4D|nr:carboxylesterase family protein [Streptomyces sp. NRRL F-5727]
MTTPDQDRDQHAGYGAGAPEVALVAGRVRGAYVGDGVAGFLGVPYARAPFGPLRFRAPEPVEPWEGVRKATEFGPTAPKRPYAPPLDALLPDPVVEGDDCLHVNVWAPWSSTGPTAPTGPTADHSDSSGSNGRPVMVWIHGGSLIHGSNAVPVYDGTAFARDGVVLVSVNYRLGVEGFGVFPDAPANLGLRDQIAALVWIRDNIAAFGGDPGRVTVFGESAGAISIAALLASPLARGLFRRAIVQSGAPMAVPLERARRTTRAMAERLGIPATTEAFAAVDRERLLTVQTEVTAKGSPLTGAGHSFQIAVDGDVLPRDPAETLTSGGASAEARRRKASGHLPKDALGDATHESAVDLAVDSADVDLLLGTTAEEYRLWFVPSGLVERLSPVMLRLALWKARVPSRAARVYRANRPRARPGEVLGALATDRLLRVPLNRVADARLRSGAAGRTFLYEFGWPSPVLGLGACHALELGFVFDTLDAPEAEAMTGPDAPRALAAAMHAAWVAFATEGDPGWRAWDAERPVMTFGPGRPSLVLAPREDERRSWGA